MIIALLAPAASLSAASSNSGTGLIGNWSPGIGDPSIGGWITVVAYFAAMALCVAVSRSLRRAYERPKSVRRERALWCILAIALCLLGINKQLDLQSAMTEALRIMAKANGWYRDRGVYQGLFIVALGTVALVVMIALAYMTRRLSPWTKLSVVGSVLIISFVVVRAASFHHFDAFIHSSILSLKMNWILELGGISIVLLSAMMRLKERRVRAPEHTATT